MVPVSSQVYGGRGRATLLGIEGRLHQGEEVKGVTLRRKESSRRAGENEAVSRLRQRT